MRDPKALTLAEIQTLGASLVAQSDGSPGPSEGFFDLATIADTWSELADRPILGEGGSSYVRIYVGVPELRAVIGALRSTD
ncbi:hypothetical protein [Brevundimonas bacteroides]|uniref:hypothetical protein n=1 Tax=Brevundimonas bacteroides TaxID=74311 RepID=UPI0004950286|nr:hypothetical protein [Brevundimonas bacteroides]